MTRRLVGAAPRLAWAWSAVLACAGCYLHHGPSDDPMPDATVDAGVDATHDALIDAPVDAANEVPQCEIVRLMPEPIEAAVDIVWAIDSSMSMQDERDRLQVTINDFARRIRRRVSDLHVVVITRYNTIPPPLSTDPDSFLFVSQEVGSNDALLTLRDSYMLYAPFLRADALLHFVVVSDDDSSVTADQFKQDADALFGKPYTVHAIASPDVNGGPCRSEVPSPLCLATGIQAVCGAAAIGVEYYRAATLTGGLTIDVCVDDWSHLVLRPLSDTLIGAEPVPCRSQLPRHTNGDRPVQVTATLYVTSRPAQTMTQVNAAGECGLSNGFYREPHEGSDFEDFVLCPGPCRDVTESGGSVDIKLDCGAEPVR